MPKRKNPQSLSREKTELKAMKKTKIIPKMKFLFITRNEHTKWISDEKFSLMEEVNWLPSEVVTVKVPIKKPNIERCYADSTLLKYLDHLLLNKETNDLYLEKIEEEKVESEHEEEMSEQNKIDLKEELISDLYEKKIKASAIADTFGIKVKQVYNIHQKIKKKKDSINMQQTPKRFLITQEMYDELEIYMSQPSNRLSTLASMRKHLIEKFHLQNKRIALSTISKMLKRLSFSRKRTKKIATRRNITLTREKRTDVARRFLSAERAGKEIIFIDETGFNQQMIPLYGYSKIGERCLVSANFRSQNYTVIAAITKSRILGYQIFKGSVKAEDFGSFIASLLNEYPEILQNRSKYVFFMDNAPIHKAKTLKPFFENFSVLFNAPYSPFLNSIEEFFGNWKYHFRKKFRENTVDIVNKILRSVKEIDKALLFSFYNHVLVFLKDCIHGNSIL